MNLKSSFSVSLALLLSAVGCSGEGGFNSTPFDGPGLGSGSNVLHGPCEEGQSQACGITLEQGNGTVSCYRGKQYCEDGRWSECRDGRFTHELDPTSDMSLDPQLQALSVPMSCGADNPCDPNCMFYGEDPTPDITTTMSGGPPATGLPAYPGVPAAPACSHNACDEGAALVDGCSACVTSVCANASTSYCCSTTWDEGCVNASYALCDSSAAPVGLCEFAVFAQETLTYTGGAVSGGHVGAGNSGGADPAVDIGTASSATMSSVYSGGNVDLSSTTISGDVIYTGTTLNQSGSSIGGSDLMVSSFTAPTIPTKSISCSSLSGSRTASSGTTTISPGDNRTTNINSGSATVVLDGPGDYGRFVFNSAGSLVFNGAGTYTMQGLVMNASGSTLLVPDGDLIEIDVCTTLSMANNPRIRKFTYSDSCSGVPVFSAGTAYSNGQSVQNAGGRYQCKVAGWCSSASSAYEPGVGWAWSNAWDFTGACSAGYSATSSEPDTMDVRFYSDASNVPIAPGALGGGGLLIVPNGTVVLNSSGGSTIDGLIYAENVTSSGTSANVNATGLTGALCESIISGGAAPGGSCPIPNGDPGVPPAINEPCGTGLDCQINHRCVEPETDDLGASCPHSKCAPGVAMTNSCADTCVERICDVDASCCTTEWTQGCVDMVATVCDAVCGTPGCVVDPCETSASPLDASCDPCIANVCASIPSCCSTEWTSACVAEAYDICSTPTPDPPTTGDSICDYAVYSAATLSIQGSGVKRSTILGGGWIGSPSSSSMAIQYVNMNTSNVTSSGSLNLSYVDGSGEFVSGSGSLFMHGVTGGFSAGSGTAPVAPRPTRSFSCSGSDGTPSSGTVGPGNYGNVTVSGTMTLQAGTYTFGSLTMASGSTLVMPATGDITLNVCGNVLFNSGASMTGLSAATAMNLDIYTQGSFTAQGNNNIYGFINSQGSISINNDSYVIGLLISGTNSSVQSGSTVDVRGLSTACKSKGHDGSTPTSTPVACPVTVTPTNPSESATCTQNALTYEDTTCAGYDLAVDIPCDDEMPVCNHGTVDFSGTVEIGYWADSGNMMSQESPSVSPTGTCSQMVSIDAGDCTTVTCVVPAGTHTVMVDPNENLAECDVRRMDNWSVHDGRSCGSTAVPLVVEHEYEAVCPDSMSGLWGLLTWDSDTPSSSSITFSARTAESSADLPAASYTELGKSEVTPIDTQLCTNSGPSPCPIDITDVLALGTNQDDHRFMTLRIELDPTGGAPTLHDWRITYTCVIDQ